MAKRHSKTGNVVLSIIAILLAAFIVLAICYWKIPKFKTWTDDNIFKTEKKVTTESDAKPEAESFTTYYVTKEVL